MDSKGSRWTQMLDADAEKAELASSGRFGFRVQGLGAIETARDTGNDATKDTALTASNSCFHSQVFLAFWVLQWERRHECL